MARKAWYPVCLFLLTAAICWFSALKKQLDTISGLTFFVWPMWITVICYFFLGGVFVIAFVMKKHSELKQSALVICNLIFGALNVGLYFCLFIHPFVPSSSTFLIFAGLLIFSAPLKLNGIRP